jgi:predicted transcriptional regulator
VIHLPDDLRSALDHAARAEGISIDELLARALKRYLFVHRFRQLRSETLEHMRATGQGELADDDVFGIIS